MPYPDPNPKTHPFYTSGAPTPPAVDPTSLRFAPGQVAQAQTAQGSVTGIPFALASGLTHRLKARAWLGTSGTLSGSSPNYKLNLNYASYDLNGNFDIKTNFRYTVPLTGYYLISALVTVSLASTTNRVVALIRRNGVTMTSGSEAASDGTQAASLASDVRQLSANDYLELFMYYDAAGLVNVSLGETTNYLAIHYLST